MKKKLRIGILFGGRSGEHEVSLLSAASILKAIDKKKYDVVPIGITREGRWVTAADAHALLTGKQPPENPRLAGDPEATPTAAVLRRGEAIIVPPVPAESLQPLELHAAAELAPARPALSLDVVFPVLHGTFGEDGTIQGLFELADIAYVGSGVLGSAAGMDKAAMKKLFSAAGLPQTPYLAMLRSEWRSDPKRATKKIEAALKYPIFVKPANLGSSVGISKVHDRSELAAAMDLAASFDRKLVIEQGVGGPGAKPRELEVAVLGNDTPEASVVGEIVPGAEFYDYEAKYLSRRQRAHHPGKTHRGRVKANPPDGHRSLQSLRLRRTSPRRLPHGACAKKGKEGTHLPQRDQHPSRLHQHQHVPQALGSLRPPLQTAHRPPHPARRRTPSGKAANSVHPRLN